jgi:hypothetical protein
MATLQFLSFMVVEWQVGSISTAEDLARRALGKGYRTRTFVNSLGLDMLFLARVTMGCEDAGGTKGGVEDAKKSARSGDSAELEEAEERGYSGVECREWEEWGEEGSRTSCVMQSNNKKKQKKRYGLLRESCDLQWLLRESLDLQYNQ